MSRYTRDEIISQALDLAHSPTIKAHDMPGDVILPNAWSIKWLQNALDMFHRLYPFSGDVTTVSMIIPANNTDMYLTGNNALYLPQDFMVDIRNGLEVTFNTYTYRLRRLDYQRWLNYKIAYQNISSQTALCYTIISRRIKALPLVTANLSATLHYFRLPDAPGPDDYVDFPDEFTLIEFIRLKSLEWTRAQGIPPGTAQVYMQQQLSKLRSSGLLNEPEYESGIPLENNQVIPESLLLNRNAWMGGWLGS